MKAWYERKENVCEFRQHFKHSFDMHDMININNYSSVNNVFLE